MLRGVTEWCDLHFDSRAPGYRNLGTQAEREITKPKHERLETASGTLHRAFGCGTYKTCLDRW